MTPVDCGRCRGRATLSVLMASILLVLAAAACGGSAAVTLGPVVTASVGVAASEVAAIPASPVTGLVTNIESTGLTKVSAITLRTAEGTQITFRIGVLENGTEFPPGHLTEHMATSSPVRVFFRQEGADLVVYRLEDGD